MLRCIDIRYLNENQMACRSEPKDTDCVSHIQVGRYCDVNGYIQTLNDL